MNVMTFKMGSLLFLLVVACPALAQEKKDLSEVEKALLKNAEAFVETFNRADAKALSEFWQPSGDYISQSGNHLKGRQAIARAFQAFFAENKGAKLRINITSFRVVKPDLVLEDGITEVLPGDGGPPQASRYSLVHVKGKDGWKLASVREAPYTPPTNYQYLKVIEWLTGDWADDKQKGEVAKVSFTWTDNQNFIIGSITSNLKDIPISGATQWIGWDPVAKQIRSWSFASNGGFGQAVWSRKGKTWSIKTKFVFPDGSQLSSTNIITRVDANTITWQSTERSLDGKKLPDTEVIRMKRQQ